MTKQRQRWSNLTPRSLVLVRDELCLPWGYVYVFGAQMYVKIGMTKFDIYRRWHAIKTSNPWLERPLYVSPPLMERVMVVERNCHEALQHFRVSGEWFDCPRDFAIEVVQEMINETGEESHPP
jgi:hypothetical protein